MGCKDTGGAGVCTRSCFLLAWQIERCPKTVLFFCVQLLDVFGRSPSWLALETPPELPLRREPPSLPYTLSQINHTRQLVVRSDA